MPYMECAICDKEFSGPEPYAQHLTSKAHLLKMEEEGIDKSKFLANDSGAGEKYKCDVCNVELSGPVPFEQHNSGSKHKSTLNKKRILEENEVQNPNEQAGPLKCEVCKKCFSGPESLEDHLKSKKHLRKVEMTDMKIRLTNQEPASCPPMPHEEDRKHDEQTLYPSLPQQDARIHVIPNRAQKVHAKPKKSPGCFTAFRASFKKKNKNKK